MINIGISRLELHGSWYPFVAALWYFLSYTINLKKIFDKIKIFSIIASINF